MYDQPPTLHRHRRSPPPDRDLQCPAAIARAIAAVFALGLGGQRAGFPDGDITQLRQPLPQLRGAATTPASYTEPHEFALNPAGRAGRGPRRKLGAFRLAPRASHASSKRSGRGAFAGAGDRGSPCCFWGLDGRSPRPPARGSTAYLSHSRDGRHFRASSSCCLSPPSRIGLRRYWAEVGGEPSALAAQSRRRWWTRRKRQEPLGRRGRGVQLREGRPLLAGRAAMRIRRCSGASCCAFARHLERHRSATTSSTGPAPYGIFSLPKLLGLPGGITAGAGLRAADPAEAQGRRRPRRAVGLGRGGGLRGTAGPDGPDRPRALRRDRPPRWSRRFWHCISERSSPSSWTTPYSKMVPRVLPNGVSRAGRPEERRVRLAGDGQRGRGCASDGSRENHMKDRGSWTTISGIFGAFRGMGRTWHPGVHLCSNSPPPSHPRIFGRHVAPVRRRSASCAKRHADPRRN